LGKQNLMETGGEGYMMAGTYLLFFADLISNSTQRPENTHLLSRLKTLKAAFHI
jgi:hypothetical protein